MKIKYILSLLFIFSSLSSANGLLIPTNENYPYDFIRNTVTRVTVNIKGCVAETSVYQEFKNEWYDSTNAVYSFPLPPEARAVNLSYWYKGYRYKAVLQVKEQATNPGTGEGGVAALVNNYIGRNGIKILLTGIGAGEIQKVELNYVSVCDYYLGRANYEFPLATGDFTDYPLENLSFFINIESNSEIKEFDITSHDGYRILESSSGNISAEYIQSKAYINKDFKFYYDINPSELGVDFYSSANDSSDGHFVLFVKPEVEVDPQKILNKRIFFVLSNSSSMSGTNFEQSLDAVKTCLDDLNSGDFFNIIVFNYNVYEWQNEVIAATPENIQSAKTYLDAITLGSGSHMDYAIEEALTQITDDSLNNSILVFTDGYSPLDPRSIESMNTYKASIYPVGIGDKVDRARLEMTASLNYGYVTYVEENEGIKSKILKLMDLVNKPLLKEVGMEYGNANVNQLTPNKFPSASAGSMFYVAGRFSNSGQSAFSLAGKSTLGLQSYDFSLDFSDSAGENMFAESLWAKLRIDALEWEIEIYGESYQLKNELIELSLKYNIRCRYTAYIADYSDIHITKVKELSISNSSYLLGNYPNPFNPSTTLRIFIGDKDIGKVKLIRIYNSIGQLVRVIDVSSFGSGWNEFVFNGKNQFGSALSSGIYFVQFVSGGEIHNTIKVNLLK